MPNVRITLNTSLYKSPTQEDLDAAKKYILRRNEYATLLGNSVDECLLNTAQQIVTICYKYDVDPKKFFIGSDYNEKMMDEISQVMDEAEEEILSFIYDYSTESVQETATALGDSSSRKKELLAAWIATLGRKNRNLQDTLDGYLFKTMKDVEAAVAALRNAGIALADAVTKVKSNLHSIYTMPEVAAAFKESDDFNATYIRSRGVEQGAVGLSNSGATNVVNMAKITLQMAWMREQGIEFDESGAAGYYQLRGSSYPCDICDAEVGFHKGLEELYTKPYPHPHCCCYRIPIFPIKTEDENNQTENDRWEEYQMLSNDENYHDVEYDSETGGLKATHQSHKVHINDNKRYFNERLNGDELEKEFQDKAFKLGHSVIFRAEANNKIDLDMMLDGVKMDLVSVTENSKAFNNQIGRKNKQLKDYNDLYGENNNALCMYFHNPSFYSYDKVENGMNILKRYGADVIIKDIFVLLNDGTDIFKLSFQ